MKSSSFFLVPLQPPSNIKVFNTSSFCLMVTWSHISKQHAQGIITGYYIYISKKVSNTWNRVQVPYVDNKEICSLEPYTFYEVEMEGFTIKGEGPRSSPAVEGITDEYGMLLFYILWYGTFLFNCNEIIVFRVNLLHITIFY